MLPAYAAAAEESGRGSHARRQEAVVAGVCKLRDSGAFRRAAEDAAARLSGIVPAALAPLKGFGAEAARRLEACFPETEDIKFTPAALSLKARILEAARRADSALSEATARIPATAFPIAAV